MLSQFANSRCDIETSSLDATSADGLLTFTPVYTDIICKFVLSPRGDNNSNTNLSENTNLQRYNVVIEPDKVNVTRKDRITLRDTLGATVGVFQVDDVAPKRSIRGNVNHIYLSVSSYSNG